jgi:LPS-assembly protein
MDMIVGSEYYSKRGWAPNGDFRYKGPGLDHLTLRVNALFDRGFVPAPSGTPTANCLPTPTSTGAVNQGGVDVNALGRKDLTPETRLAGNVEYLSCYVYRLVFNDTYSQAVNSEVQSSVSLTHAHNGFVPSASLERFETFASSSDGDEARILHLPNLRFDVLDRPLGSSWLYWGLGSSLGYLTRSEPASIPTGTSFHARNAGRIDFYPHLSAAALGRRLERAGRGRAARDGLHHQPDPDLRGSTAAHRPSATTRSTAAMWKPPSTSGRRPWSGISRSPAGIANCAT